MKDEEDMLLAWQRAKARGDMRGAVNFSTLPKGSDTVLQDKINAMKEQADVKAKTARDLMWLDEASKPEPAMEKLSSGAMRAANMLEEMAKKFTLEFKNMDDVKYRIFGKAYLQHQMLGVNTGRYYDSGVHVIDGNEAVNLMRNSTRSGRWSVNALAQSKAVDYMHFIGSLKKHILTGYALSVIALKIMDFFNVGTNAISYRTASYIARRLHDIIFLMDGGHVNNRFWRAMALVQLVIKRTENDNQHVGYTNETDLRGMATTIARYPTFTVDNHTTMLTNIDSAYRHYYA